MKNILVLFFLSLSLTYSQDSEPTSWEFIWGHSTTPRPFVNDSSKQESIMTGFQWGGSSQMNNALFNNLSTGSNYTPPTEPINTTTNLIFQPTWLGSTGYSPGYFKAVMMQYEPTLPLDGTNEGTIFRPADKSDPIFGFRNRNGRILTDTTDDNYSRIVLEKDSSYTGGKVLDDIWPQPNFDSEEKGGQTDSYKGKLWYLTINLRRLKPSIETTKDNSVVLSIKMPYLKWNSTTDFIKFNKIPSNVSNDTIQLNSFEDRGIAQRMILIDPPIDSVAITRNMLPVSSDGYENITISAEFITNGNPLRNNIFSRDSTTGKEIKEFDIEVNYFGHTDVAIDYIRVENVRAHHLLRGKFDSLGTMVNWPYRDKRGNIEIAEDPDNPSVTTQVNTIKDIIQSTLDTLKIETSNWADANLFRFKFQDTENKSYYWWGTLRYCNKFSNGMFMTRDGIRNPKLYYYYTKSPNKWLGIGFGGSDRLMPAPYARHSNRTYDGMKLEGGFSRIHNDYAYKDTLSSEYETQLLSLPGDTAQWNDLKRDSYYFDTLFAQSWLTQVQYEGQAFEHYYKNNKVSSFLYSDNPWWFYGLFHNFKMSINADSDSVAVFDNYRIKTAEEYRLIASSALIMGCKGFINDGDQNKRFPDIINSVGSLGIGDYNKLPANDLLSDSVGTDFVNAKYNTWNAWNYIDLERTAQEMEIDTSRIYIGTKSMRAELFEQHSFIRANDDLLMNLKLASAMSKGFRKYYTQDEDSFGTDTLMSKFISLDESNAYSTRLVKKSVFDNNLVEPFDSSFFDITILRDADIPMDSIFYLAVLNRRTDPLIYYTNPLNPSQKYLRFLSSAEFLDSCENSADTALYRSYWWKRQGARKLTIPFNYTYSDTNDYNLLRISEIGSDVDSLNSLIHRDPKYYDMVTDTVIGQDRSLSFNLLPGQAKILKVEVLKTDMVSGFLDNYNQNNLVEYRDPTDSNKIVYHLAYYKNSYIPDTNIVYKEVHYIQSIPIRKNDLSENIRWNAGSRVNVSKDFFIRQNPLNPLYEDCNHPALVVREDSSGIPHPYIVYTCTDSLGTGANAGRVVLSKILPIGGATVSNEEIFELNSNNIERFGTPTINASAYGNYIAWTDSLRGLLVAYQDTNSNTPIDIDSIKIHEFPDVFPKSILYPSFNTYSHMENGENNAGLVWYQMHDTIGGIYYSRISFDDDNDTLVLNIPDNYQGGINLQKDINNKMVKISTTNKSTKVETKPIIFRSLGSYVTTDIPECIYNRIDNIDWIDDQTFVDFSTTKIAGITFYYKDTNHVTDSWNASKLREIYLSGTRNTDVISSINSAQQDGIIIGGEESEVAGNYNLNFTLDTTVIYQMPKFNGSILLNNDLDNNIEGYYPKVAPRKAATGSMTQLAKSKQPNFEELNNMWKNRRVFETHDVDSLDNPIIKASANLFYKAAYEDVIDNHVLMGFTGDSNNVYFDLPKFENDPGSISTNPVNFENVSNLTDPCPTDLLLSDLTADSFKAKGLILSDANNDGEMEMEITIYGYRNSDVNLILERAYDSAQVVLTMPTITAYPANATKLIYSIIDSTTTEFNLIYQNNDTTAHYNEKAFIGGLQNNDTISYKSAIQKDPVKYIIDFNNGGIQYEAKNINDFELTVYPNPTSGNLKVQAFLPEKLDGYKIENRSLVVTIYDATGRKVTTQNGATGQMFDFDLSNSPAGAYIINVEHNEGNKKYSATERIVKE
jgi:type IX secretion system substrate protein